MALIKDGYWQDTYWASRYWQEDYWAEYGSTTVVVSGRAGPHWLKVKHERPLLSRELLVSLKSWLESKVK